MIYNLGGTESFTAKFVETIQSIRPNDDIIFITELYEKSDALTAAQFKERLLKGFGVKINEEKLQLNYIITKEVIKTQKCKKNIFLRLKRKIETNKFQKELLAITKKTDLFINCSNLAVIGDAKRNLTLIHFPQDKKSNIGIYKSLPFLKPLANSFDNKYKNCYELFMPNSNFTSFWLKEKWQIPNNKIKVFYPIVTPIKMKKEKKNQIFVCGRLEKEKKIDLLISAFKKSKLLNEKYHLKIAGSCSNGDMEYIEYLRKTSGDNIEIIFKPTREELDELYAESNIFWHAKGYGETNPMLMEHFGMTTVEAMSAGCIPIVINKGGQKEIVTKECGFLWDTPEELIARTEETIQMTPEKIEEMRKACIERSRICSEERFINQIREIL